VELIEDRPQTPLLFHQSEGNRADFVEAGSRRVPVQLVRKNRAKRYILRVTDNGILRVTLPRWGSKREALAFAERESAWIERQLEKRATQPTPERAWGEGTTFLFRGELVSLRIDPLGRRICFADEEIVGDSSGNVRELVEGFLRQRATGVLVPRTIELAHLHQTPVRRVVVRSQKTRWGSCSIKGTISLNWRLIQTPPLVLDYIIVHELMHLREMNHSTRFWKHVAEACPEFGAAEKWLKHNQRAGAFLIS